CTLRERLFPVADIVTPNIPEAEVLSGMKINSADDMEKSAEIISHGFGCTVLLKGGHSVNDASDLLYHDGKFRWLISEKINNPNTHGTGCTLSSAIASNLAKGCDMIKSVEQAKEYVTGAISAGLDLGKGSGPLNHMYKLKG
ncbi:MAG: hydroxymethylpyrimidine/phosphomethylpyrimidine kinase, partial [Oscillospiraceae bacterium]|nr:hydroxymethylpyrimidine/phosphomethylpyrimidine kinase [Oscillospiraceae bacterium]